MPSRTCSHSPSGFGKSLPEQGLLLLVVLVLLEGSVLPLGAASSPDVSHQDDSHNHKVADHGVNATKKVFPVLDVDYHHIQTPFEISLWVLLASLMKLGEYHVDVMFVTSVLPAACHFSSAHSGNASVESVTVRLGMWPCLRWFCWCTITCTSEQLKAESVLSDFLLNHNQGKICLLNW